MTEEGKTREESTGMELLRRLADDVRGDASLWTNLDCCNDAWWGAEQLGERLHEALRGIADKIEADYGERPMPEGVEWPRYGDGRKVAFGDRVRGHGGSLAVREVSFDTYGVRTLFNALHDPIIGLCAGERLDTRPNLAADGKPLVEGETVYSLSNGWAHVVASVEPGGRVKVRRGLIDLMGGFAACDLTHVRPEVLDFDGLPVHVGDTVYIPEDGSAWEVLNITQDGRMCLSGIGWYRPCAVRITPPDSQEAIDSDALKGAGDYGNAHPEAAALWEHGLSRKQAQIADLLRRQRELTGGE